MNMTDNDLAKEAGIFDVENVRWPTVGRYAAGGAAAGASVASVLALLHMLSQARDEKRRAEAASRTGEDTVVLTLPRPKDKEEEAAEAVEAKWTKMQEARIIQQLRPPSRRRRLDLLSAGWRR